MMNIKGMKKIAFILIVSLAILVYNIGTYDLIANKGVDILSPSYNASPPGQTEITPSQEIEPPLGNETVLPGYRTIFTMMVYNFPIELTIVFFAEMVFTSLVREDRKKMNFLRVLILLGSAAALTVVNSANHYFLVWPAIHDWPIHAGHQWNDTSTTSSGILRPLYGVQEGPINNNHTLSAESFTFIQETNLSKNQITKYQWISNISVQGIEVTREQFLTLQGLSPSERVAYFEDLDYYEGIKDSKKTSVNSDGSIYFVFYNPNTELAFLDVTYTYQYTFFTPAVTILMLILAALIILGIHFLAFKYIQKLSNLNSGVSLIMPAIYYPVIWNILARQTREQDFLEKTGNQFMFALIVSGIFLLTIILILIWNLTLVGTKSISRSIDTESQELYQQK